jgi:hypothetical protein
VIEKLEPVYSGVRRRNIKAPRREVWKDAFETSTRLLDMMRKIYDKDLSEAAAAEIVVGIYARCATETHSPGNEVLPIRLGLLTQREAKVMVQLCQLYPVQYQVYGSDGVAVENVLYVNR